MKTSGYLVLGGGSWYSGPRRGTARVAVADKVICCVYRGIAAGSPSRLVGATGLPASASLMHLTLTEDGNDFFEAWPSAPYIRFSAALTNALTVTMTGYDTLGRPAACAVTVPPGSTYARMVKAFSKVATVDVLTTGSESGKTISIGDCDPSSPIPENAVPALGLPLIYATWGFSMMGWRRPNPDAAWEYGFHGTWQPGKYHNEISTHYDPRGLWMPHYSPPAPPAYPDGVADYLVGHHVHHKHDNVIHHIPRRL